MMRRRIFLQQRRSSRPHRHGVRHTVPRLRQLITSSDQDVNSKVVFSKTDFSMVTADTKPVIENYKTFGTAKTIVLCGWETHVCVLQTCLDLLELGFGVWVVEDAVGSQRNRDRAAAIGLMRQAGACITTLESVLFLIMKSKDHEKFKEIQALVISHAKNVKAIGASASTSTNGIAGTAAGTGAAAL
ncbi:unnamed protein product [Amoebophrya sp. A25]|nr:unnamed protein product [Amoebophrya sp. A25]|eukprot:GSA25T00003302001.1